MTEMHRSLTEKVLDRAESDPEWRQLLIEDPELAMREANFPEAQVQGQGLQQRQGPQQGQGPQRPREREVVGQWWPGGGGGYGYGYGYGYGPRCSWHWSWRWGWYRTY